MTTRYAARGDLVTRGFDDGLVVFDRHSWCAHVLNPAAAAVFELCLAGPVQVAEVADLLGEVLDSEERVRAPEHAARLLGELEELDVLVRQDGDAPA